VIGAQLSAVITSVIVVSSTSQAAAVLSRCGGAGSGGAGGSGGAEQATASNAPAMIVDRRRDRDVDPVPVDIIGWPFSRCASPGGGLGFAMEGSGEGATSWSGREFRASTSALVVRRETP
jgi:hypothetical protein